MSGDLPGGRDELFVLPRRPGELYVYAPLRRCVAVVNEAAVDVLRRLRSGDGSSLTETERDVVRRFESAGLIGGEAPGPPVFPDNMVFQPHEVTLFPTTRCNLRCRYCYADAGRRDRQMPWPVARAAIDLVAENAGILGSPKLAVGFHGGGEPLMAWDLVVRCVEHARRRANEKGLDAEIFAASNGFLSPEQRDFVVAHFTTITVSLDGPPDIQDYNRPTASGQGSYTAVRETLRTFEEHGFPYSVRATVTASTAARMVEIVEHLAGELKLSHLHLEPVWQCGRCASSGELAPGDEVFIPAFLAAVKRGRELGVEVSYSGARLGVLTSKFCAAPGDGFSVLPEGVATSCFEITELDDPRAQIFHYGRYVEEEDAFVFDQERIAALRRLSVEHIPYCQDCFVRWHCAGDCLAKVFQRSGAARHEGSQRCGLNRALTLASLEEMVQGEERHG